MRRLKVFLAVLSLMAIVETPAYADFSYSLRVAKHSIIVTALGNGKFFLKLDGKAYKPEMFPKEPFTAGVKPAPRIRVKKGQFDLAILDKGRLLYLESERNQPYELMIEVFAGKGPFKDVKKWVFGYVAGRAVYIWPSPRERADDYLFYYSFRSKGRTYRISQTSSYKAIPKDFRSALASFKLRRAKEK